MNTINMANGSSINVGTVGHIDHGRMALYGSHHIKQCTCLTKTPELEYHNPTCEYRIHRENWYERQKTQPSGEAPTNLQ